MLNWISPVERPASSLVGLTWCRSCGKLGAVSSSSGGLWELYFSLMFLGQPGRQAVNKVEMRKHLLRLLLPLIHEHVLMLQLTLFLEIKSLFPCYLLKYDGLSVREKAVLWMCPDLFEISCLSICTESSRGGRSSFLPLKSSFLPKPVVCGGEGG